MGKVHKLELDKGGDRTRATLYIQPEFAPLPRDTTAILRQKTLLGETYRGVDAGASVSRGVLKDGALLRGRAGRADGRAR